MNDAYYNQLPEMHQLFHDLNVMSMEDALIWRTMETAPKDGRDIEISYGDGSNAEDNCLAFWSERPVCMGGPTVMHKPGWATAGNDKCDKNLPLDPPKLWRPGI